VTDPGLRTPLTDFFRRGEVARDVKMLAARGALAPRPLEQLAILVLLCDDPEPDIASAARATIDALPRAPLASYLGRPDVPEELRAFFAARGVPAATPSPEDLNEPLLETSGGAAGEQADDAGPVNAALISTLPIMDRLKMAMKGTREQRAVLIRDPNKLIAVAVLSSPKVTEAEIEAFTKMGNVSEEVLRIIGFNRGWTKHYGVVLGLVRNPKTPPAIAMNMLNRLNERDVKMVAVDRNVPEALRAAARKFLVKTLNR
jgi:hypothetical protein